MTVIILDVIMGLLILAIIFCVYMLYRNNCVYEYRTKLLWSDYEAYETLPDYGVMVGRWWVWPMSKFLK